MRRPTLHRTADSQRSQPNINITSLMKTAESLRETRVCAGRKKKSVMAIMPPVCHWVTWLGYFGEIYAFGFWVALGFRFKENCLDMITHQTGTVVFWVKAMRDRRLGPRPGTFLCLFVLFKLLLKILPLAFAKGICALLQKLCPLQYENKIDTRSSFWENAVEKEKKMVMAIEHNILSRFLDNKDDVSITILGQAGMAGLPSECWDSLQAQKNVCFNSKWCTVVPYILLERDNDKVATMWSYWEEVAAEHQNKLVQVLPQLPRALPPDLCCVILIKLPPWLFWSLPLCMTSHLKSKPAWAHSSRHWPIEGSIPELAANDEMNSQSSAATNSKLSFFSWCVALRYTCDVRRLQPEEKRQTVCQWASLAALLGNVGVFGSLSPFFWKACLLFKNIFLNYLMVFFDLSYFCFNNIVTQMHHLFRIIHRFVRYESSRCHNRCCTAASITRRLASDLH